MILQTNNKMLQSVSFTKTNNTKERGDKITKHFPHNKHGVVAIIYRYG